MLQVVHADVGGYLSHAREQQAMTIAEFSALALKASLPAIVFAIGLATTGRDVTSIFGNPGLLLRSIISTNVVAPLLAIALVTTLPVSPPVKIALVMLAVSPVPPMLLKREFKAGGEPSYAISLLATSAVLSIVVIPVSLELLSRFSGLPLGIAPLAIIRLVASTVMIPLVLGIIVHVAAPDSSESAARFIGIAGTLLLIIGVLPVLIRVGPMLGTLIGDGTLLVIVAFAVGALICGHWLGGPNRNNRTVLAMSTAARHPAIAIALVTANFPEQRLAVPAVLLYVIVCAVVVTPYVIVSRRRHDAPIARAATRPRGSETPSRQR